MICSLIGLKYAGKTRLGRLAAEALAWNVLDTDALFITKTHLTPRAWVHRHGEPSFRDMEANLIATLQPKPNTLITTGGGSLLRDDNVAHFKRLGPLIYLRVPLEELRKRQDQDSPAIALNEIERDERYSRLADHLLLEYSVDPLPALIQLIRSLLHGQQ